MSRTKGAANRKENISRLKTKFVVRDQQINFRCTAEQKEMMNRISIEFGESVADIILQAVHSYAGKHYKIVRSGITQAELNEVFE